MVEPLFATDGADLSSHQPTANHCVLVCTRWAIIGRKAGEWSDVGLTSEVVWRIDNGMISREETLSSEQTVTVKSWEVDRPQQLWSG